MECPTYDDEINLISKGCNSYIYEHISGIDQSAYKFIPHNTK